MRWAWLLLTLFTTPAAAQTVIWEGNDLGYARGISLAVTGTHAFLSEAYTITTIELATGATTTLRVDLDGYLPVQSSVVAGDTLYLAMGYVESGTPPVIATYRAGDAAVTVLATLDVTPRSLVVSGGDVFFSSEHAIHRVRGGAVTTRARFRAPRSVHSGLATLDGSVYVLVIDEAHGYERTLVRVPPAGRSVDLGVVEADDIALVGRRIVASYDHRPSDLAAYDVDTGSFSSLGRVERVSRLAGGDELVWATGNFYAGDDVALHRLGASGPVDLFATDRRLVEQLVVGPTGYFLLLGAHPDGECHEEMRGCGSHPMPPEVSCSLPDHRLWALPR